MNATPFLIICALMVWSVWAKDWHATAATGLLIMLVGFDAIATAIKERK